MTTLTQARAALLRMGAHPSPDFIAISDYLDKQVAAQIELEDLTARVLRAEAFMREIDVAFKRLQHAHLTDALPSQQARQELASHLHQQVNLFGVGTRVNGFPPSPDIHSSAGIADGLIKEASRVVHQKFQEPVKVYTETDSTRPPR